MAQEPNHPSNDPSDPGRPGEAMTQRIQHNPTSARVPERVARGAFATGVLIIHGPQEMVLDFLQAMARPIQLVARVVMTPPVAEQFLATLRENYGRYVQSYGTPPAMPKPAESRPRTAQEIYDEIKIADEMLSGSYANAVLVGHTPAEFHMDFITSFFPHAAVASRVYVAAPRMGQLIDALAASLKRYTPPGGGAGGTGGAGGGGPGGGRYEPPSAPPSPPPFLPPFGN